MPRNASQVYAVPVGTDGTPNAIIYSGKYNTFIHDVETDLNTPRPVVAGGTGSSSADGALVNLSGEKAAQVVTNWDSTVWMPGSFYAATTASGAAPVAGHAFAGVVVINEPLVSPPTNQNVVVEARDMTDPAHLTYYRIMTAGVWGPWLTARQSIYAAPFDALAYNGMQVNGNMEVSQENGITGINVSANNAKYILDGWKVGVGSTSVVNGQQGSFVPPGYTKAIQIQVVTANASPAATDKCYFQHSIEGYRISRLAWGTASAQPVTVGFWVYAVRSGNYSGAIVNGAFNRSYAFSFAVLAASTWEFKTITVPGDTTGTWASDSTMGMFLFLTMMAGSSNCTAPGVWTAGGFLGATGTINGVASTSDIMVVTGVVVLPGIEVPSAARAPLIMRPFDQELVACQRYWEGSFDHGTMVGAVTTNGAIVISSLNSPTSLSMVFNFRVPKRATPTANTYSPATGAAGKARDAATSTDIVVTPFNTSTKLFAVYGTSVSASSNWQAHFTADARL